MAAKTPRECALAALERCRRDGAWSESALDSAIKTAQLDARDAALCTSLCATVLQNMALCDFYIGCYSSTPVVKLEPKILDILRLSVAQLALMDKIPPHAAVSEGVALAKRHNARASGLVNAVLRRVAENRSALPEVPGCGTAEYLSVRYSHPLWLCNRLCAERGYEFAEGFLAANNRPAPVVAQVNTIKTGAASLCDIWRDEGVEFEPDAAPDSFRIRPHGSPARLRSFSDGLFYVQDSAARIAVLAAAPGPGMRVLDACAAPGGKSFAAAIAMGGQGSILSCDINEKKLRRIEDGAERLGLAHMISTRAMDAREPGAELSEAFDITIADVPCSGIGVIRKKPEIRFKKEAELERLPQIQLDILRGLAQTVRPGGTLLYSTCTVLTAENESTVEAFLAEDSGFEKQNMRTLFPHIDGTDGFFICTLRKKA